MGTACLQDSPTRADTLFADADEFADELMGSPPCYREDDSAESDAKEFVPKSFDQRTRSFSASRPDDRMADGSGHADSQVGSGSELEPFGDRWYRRDWIVHSKSRFCVSRGR